MQEAQLAKTKMNGRLACGRPLVVRFASEKFSGDVANPLKNACNTKSLGASSSVTGQMSRSAKIAAIKNKLKSLDEGGCGMKKPRTADGTSSDQEDRSSKRHQESED